MRTLTFSFLFAFCCAIAAYPARAQDTNTLPEEVLDTSKSSWIEAASFVCETGSETGLLIIQVKGEKITYIDVPVAAWNEFKQSESLGKYYTDHIKQKYEREVGEPLWKRFDFMTGGIVDARVRCAFNEECEPIILDAIRSAKKSIRVAAYAFTRSRIAAALVGARYRGVDVRVKVDARQAQYSLAVKQLDYMARKGVSVARIVMEGEYAAMHNKFVVIDEQFVIAGSYNFTTTAGVANWENIVWIDSPEIAARYLQAWDAIASASVE